MRRLPVSRSLLLAAVGSSVLAGAGAAAAQSTQTPTQVDDIIVTGAPYGVSQRAAVIATDVLDEETLATAPAASLGDLLNGRPGVRSTDFAPGASRPVIRGLSGPRVQVLTNGIGLIDASSVSPDHAVAADPAESNRIEIIRGPATLVYGGSAIGGVVNILDDRIPTKMPEGGIDGVVSAQASSVDDGRGGFARVTAGAGNFAFNVDAVKRKTDDYDIPAPAMSQRLADREGVEREDTGSQPNSYTDLEAWGVGGSYIGDKGFARGEYRFDDGPFSAVRGSYGHAKYTHTEFEDVGEPGTVFNSDGWEGRADLVQRERNGWNGAVGVQALSRTFEAIGEEAFVPTVDIDELGIYTVQRLDRGNHGFEGGLRYDRRELKGTPIGGDSELNREFDNWSASAAAFLRPAKGLFLGLSVAHNERAPSEVELFADGVHIATAAYETGDVNLDTEKVTTLEGTAHYDRGRFSGDLHVYHSWYDGFIDERPTGEEFYFDEEDEYFPVYQFTQTDAKFYGFEAEGSYAVWQDGDRTLSLEGAADYVHAETDFGPAARIPPYSVTGRLAFTSTRFDASAEVRHIGEQDRVANEFELPTDDYTLLNLSAAVRPFAQQDVTLFAEARNLTDEEAREHASFLKDIAPLPGRNLRVGVAYRF
ncbi:MAG: TonB-dependent receptor [Brevundimonas sp.]|uniref:TonB-dependent receptor n=1 Tax=Brevundimonas sp. TaxID=1871086 RepID=UPI000DBBF400|nr:TonB-dependent receptor [Brevundimonas sp.]PZU60064.1 MAG: TonB-dependent receptor [Brevundimonas sp.]